VQKLLPWDAKFLSLDPLRGLPLKVLSLLNYPLEDISPLSECRSLESLALSRTLVRDLSPLARLPLKNQRVDRTNVSSLESLRGRPLEEPVFFCHPSRRCQPTPRLSGAARRHHSDRGKKPRTPPQTSEPQMPLPEHGRLPVGPGADGGGILEGMRRDAGGGEKVGVGAGIFRVCRRRRATHRLPDPMANDLSALLLCAGWSA